MNAIQLFAVFLSVFLFARAQGQNRLIVRSQQLNDTAQGNMIKKIKLSGGNLGRKIKLTYADGTDSLIDRRSVWGYQKAKERITRLVGQRGYEVLETGYVILYKSSNVNGNLYYFSKDLNSELNPLNQRTLIKELGDDGYLRAKKESALLRNLID